MSKFTGKLFGLTCGLLLVCGLQAQQRTAPERNFFENVGVGGNLGLRFGSPTYVEVSPIAGYRLSSFLMPGVGVSYRYIRYRYLNYPPEGANLYGASVWVRAYVAPMIFGYAEAEVLNGEWDPYFQPDVRYNIYTQFLGAGYSQELGGSSTYVMVLFAMNRDFDSPYVNPVIRVGFMVGGTAE
jgi:hypothetical protein